MLFFPGFLDFLDIWVFYPDVLTNLYFSADDVSGYTDWLEVRKWALLLLTIRYGKSRMIE